MKNKSLYILPILLLLAAAGCKKEKQVDDLVTAFSMSDTMMSKCQFALAQMQDVKAEMRLFGKIVPDNNLLAQVYPIVGGNVQKINVELGDFVKKGQVLAVIRSGEVAEFEKERLDALNDLAIAEKNVKVAKELFAGKLNSDKDVASAESELAKARAELNRINEIFDIYSLGKNSIFNITAPISGFIVYKDINQGEQLRADKADILFSIAQIDEVWVLANVNESDISKVALGYDAQIQTISYPGKIYTGKIDRIFNAIDPATKAMKVRIKIPNADYALKPEMNATVNLQFSENRQLVAIPSSAVIFDKNKNWVMVFRSRTDIETRQVEVHRQLGDITYLTEGLKEGEKIISKNGLLIYDALND
jgi:membrane fusion protein, heavy metal efflux system